MVVFRSYGRHQLKLKEIKRFRSSLNNSKNNKDTTLNFYENRFRANAYQANKKKLEILNENQHLIRKIAAIHINASQAKPSSIPILHHPFAKAAKENKRKVLVENKRILSKILNTLPIISKKQQDSEYKTMQKYKKLIEKKRFASYESM